MESARNEKNINQNLQIDDSVIYIDGCEPVSSAVQKIRPKISLFSTFPDE